MQYILNLYNFSSFINAGSLLSESADLSSSVRVDKQFELTVECTESNGSSKWEHMGLDEHLQASVIADLVGKYRRAANYLKDTPSPSEVTLVLVCRVKSKKESLDLETMVNSKHTKHLTADLNGKKHKATSATHAVVGVVYGAEAYCVLAQDLDGDGDKVAAQNRLLNVANKMKSGLQSGQSLEDFKKLFGSNDEKSQQELAGLKCRLYCDTHVLANRETNVLESYSECLEMIRSIEKSDLDNHYKEVPVKVLLCPLEAIVAPSDGTSLGFHDIGRQLFNRCRRFWNDLELILARVGALRRATAKKSSRVSLHQFENCLERYAKLFRDSFKIALMEARETGNDDQVADVIDIAENHALFKPSRLDLWLRFKEAEIVMALKIAQDFGPTSIVVKKANLSRIIDSSDKEYTLTLNIPPLDEQTNESLAKMKDYLACYGKLVATESGCDSDCESDESDDDDEHRLPWMMIDSERERARLKFNELINHRDRNKRLESKVNILVVVTEPDMKGYQYSVYRKNHVLKWPWNMAELPVAPTRLRVQVPNRIGRSIAIRSSTKRTVSTVTILWDYPEMIDYPYRFLVEYRSKGSSESWRQQHTADSGETHAVITAKREELPIEIRVAVDTCFGRSEYSDIIYSPENNNNSINKTPRPMHRPIQNKTVTRTPVLLKPISTGSALATGRPAQSNNINSSIDRGTLASANRIRVRNLGDRTPGIQSTPRVVTKRTETTKQAIIKPVNTAAALGSTKKATTSRLITRTPLKPTINNSKTPKVKNEEIKKIEATSDAIQTSNDNPKTPVAIKNKKPTVSTSNGIMSNKKSPKKLTSRIQSMIVLKVEFITPNAARLVWSHSPAMTATGTVVNRYRVRYSSDEQDLNSFVNLDIATRVPYYRLVGLQPRTKYLVSIVMISDEGEESGEPSNTVNFITLPGRKKPDIKSKVTNMSVAKKSVNASNPNDSTTMPSNELNTNHLSDNENKNLQEKIANIPLEKSVDLLERAFTHQLT